MTDSRLRGAVLPAVVVGLLALALTSFAFAETDRPSGSHTFRVKTPAIRFDAAPAGFATVEAPGLDSRHSPLGAPDLPTRTVLVAIPPGATPRLELRLPGARTYRAIRPLPRAKEYHGPPAVLSDERIVIRELDQPPAPVYRADPEYYERAESYPERTAWLGATGVLREQRYVEVHVAPIRYESLHGGLIVDSEVEITVHYDGGEFAARTAPAEGPFEPVYRNAFVNHEQGRRFRLDHRVAGASAATTGSPVTGPLRRIRVRENGLLRLDHDLLLAEAPEFLAEPASRWRLTSQGVQVPLHIHQIPGGAFDDTLIDRAGEYVEFYGQAMDLEPKTVFVSDDGGLGDLIYEARDFTDENVYFLSVDAADQPAMPEREATPGGEPAAGPYFIDTRRVEVDEFFFPYADLDLWYSLPVITETEPVRTESVELPGLYSGTLPTTFRVKVKGSTQCRDIIPDKQSGVFVTNGLGQQLVLPGDDPDNVADVNIGVFDGMEAHVHEIAWVHDAPQPEVTSPIEVSIQLYDNTEICLDPPGEILDEALLDWIEIDYPREFVATDYSLSFDWPDGPATVFEIAGLPASGEIYEITGFLGSSYVRKAVRLTAVEAFPDGADFTIRFRMDNDPALADGTPRRFAVTGSPAIAALAPADFERDRVSELATDDSQADMVVIVHPDVVESYCTASAAACDTDSDCTSGPSDVCRLDATSDLGQLLALRASEGITSRVVRVPDIEDEFNHGLPGPQAIKQFLTWVLAGGWQGEPPAYAMLVGDGSYDYKGGTAAGNYVPTQLMLKTDDIIAFYASDSLLANIVGDDFLPDVLVGRVSVRTRAEAAVVFQKLLQYGTNPTPGSWRANALVISDRANDYGAVESEGFEQMNVDSLAWLAGSAYTSQNLRYWSDYCTDGGPPCDTDSIRADIKAGVNGTLDSGADGASLLQFVGHGNFDMWSSDVLFCAREGNHHCSQDDTLDLFNAGRLPWVVVHNCLSAAFHHGIHDKSMGEQWLKRANGGAVAVFAPSGLGFRFIGNKVIEETWGSLYGPTKDRDLLVPVMNSLVRICITQASPEACQYYVLLGDPSTRLAMPHVDPPKDLVAVAGNGEVELSWSPSTTSGASYAVYRARWYAGPQFAGNYSLVGQTAATSIIDVTPTNALEYVYYAVALDAQDFESAWSNLNSDCASDPPGEDCVLARPLNLNPPSKPTGGATEDATTGGSLVVSWNRNPENDLDHYTIHFGTTPGLGQMQDHPRGFPTLTKFHGLTNGATYYFAVSVTNTSGATSVLSDVFSGVPSKVLGVRAPELVGDLHVNKAGASDTLLSWSAVTHDIYGGEVAIGQYEVFRGTLPDFVPSPGNQLGSTPGLTFTDGGAFDGGEPDYFYLVRATDVAGNPGGAGRQLPNGIGDLRLGPATTQGNLLMSWSPVSTDFDGAPTQISHYELYVADGPFGRGDIQQGSAGLLQGNITDTSVEFLPDPENRYYSILAVDVRGNRSPF